MEMMEGLLVDRENCHIRFAEDRRIIQRPHLQDHSTGPEFRPSQDMGPAITAKFTRPRLFQIGAGEGFWLPLRIFKSCIRHHHKGIWLTTRDILAFPTMTVPLGNRITLDFVLQFSAIAPSRKHLIILLLPNHDEENDIAALD